MKSKILKPLLFLVLIASLVGCGNSNETKVDEPSKEAGSSTEASTQEGSSETGVFKIAIDYMPSDLISSFGSDSETIMTRPIYDPLYQETVEGIDYRIADDLQISDDGLKYSVRIADKANWSDGVPITSEDFRFSVAYNEHINAGFSNLSQLNGKPIELNIVDDKNFELVLPEPNNIFIYILSNTNVLPSHPFDGDPTKVDGSDYFMTPGMATSGAYSVEEVNTDSFVYKARDDYHRGSPQVHTIILKLLGSGSTRNISMENGEISYSRVTSNEQLEKYKGQPDQFNIESVSEGRVNSLHINPRSPFNKELKDPYKARQAIFMALDQNEIIMGAYGSEELAKPANSLLCPDQNLYNPDNKAYEQNIEEAKKLAEESGLAGQTLRYVYNRDRANMEEIAIVVQQLLSQIGVNVQVQGLDNAGFWAVFGQNGNGEWELGTNGIDTMRGISMCAFAAKYWMDNEIWGWSEEVIQMAKDINTETDLEKQQALANDFQEKTIEECWFYPLPYPQFVTASPANVDVGNLPIVPEFGDYLAITVE